MADNLPGKDTSVWIDTTPKTNYPTLGGKNITSDVAIVGGGITGVLAAWFLQEAGFNVALVEKSRLVKSTTGNTTAKLTSQHYLIYNYLIKQKGEAVARAYAKANEDGINDIEKLAKELSIDHDFSRRSAYVFTQDEKKVHEIKEEVKAAKKIGLPSSFETMTDLPFDIKGAIKFSDQAQFHPRKFLLGIVKNLDTKKTRIFEETEAVTIKPGGVNTVETKQGQIKAKFVVEASKYPFWRPEMFKKAMWTKLSYGLGVLLKDENQYPQDMYINIENPRRTIRSHPYKDGQIMIFGGESHKLEPGYDKNEHYRNLVEDVNKKFDVKEVVYRWVAGDTMPHDRMPYIGEYPDHPNIYIATGYRAWGLAWAMAAAQAITNKALSHPVPWAEHFSLKRLKN